MPTKASEKPLDIHLHPSTENYLNGCLRPFLEDLKAFFKLSLVPMTEEAMVEDIRKQNIQAVLLGWDCETATGCPPLSNQWIGEMVARYPETFVLGFGSVDPYKKDALDEMKRCFYDYGLKGFKFHPSAQKFFPNDKRFYHLFEFCQEKKLPVLIHTGMTGLGAGMSGGGGIKIKYTKPVPCIDDLAADFPELTIIAAHPSWPFQEEMIAIALHKANVYIDLSGWSPKYFPESLKREMKGRLNKKVLFGSDYPFLRPERWLKDFEKLEMEKEKRENVLFRNAWKILDLKEAK